MDVAVTVDGYHIVRIHSESRIGMKVAIRKVMTNATMTLKTRAGNRVEIGSRWDSRVSDVVDSDGIALVTARSAAARDDLAHVYEAMGCQVDICDSRGLKVW